MSENSINHYWLGSKFLEYCVKQGWLKQQGSCGRGTKWYPTDKGRKELKEKLESNYDLGENKETLRKRHMVRGCSKARL